MLEVRVLPGAKRAGLKAWPAGDALALRLRALQLKRGGSSRSKVFEIEGLSAAEVRARIERALETGGEGTRGH